MRGQAVLYVNGVRREVGSRAALMPLADYLRYELGLPGTKIVCAEGDCGACTVLKRDPAGRAGSGTVAVNSCIIPVAQMDGSSILTVDGLAEGDKLTPVQNAMMKCHGSQCGYCTPGFVMALTGLVEKKLSAGAGGIDANEARNALTGNLCRCTGYQPIIEAACSVKLDECESPYRRLGNCDRELARMRKQELRIEGEGFSFYAPTTVAAAVRHLKNHKSCRVLGGATDLGVVANKRKIELLDVLSLHLIPELRTVKKSRGWIEVGATVTLAEVRSALKREAPVVADYLNIFASPQIKNIGTLAGNIANASPIADTPAFLLLLDAELDLRSLSGKRRVKLEDFYVGYRKTRLKPGELIAGVRFRLPGPSDALALYKASRRRDLDISTVCLGVLKTGDRAVKVAVGGVAATSVRLSRTEKLIAEQGLGDVDAVVRSIHAEMAPISDARGSAAFRRVLVENLFRRFVADDAGRRPR